MIVTPFRRLPLTMQVLLYLEALRTPCHYAMLAGVLRKPTKKVRLTCGYLTKKGRLARVQRGRYTITRRGIAASRGGS